MEQSKKQREALIKRLNFLYEENFAELTQKFVSYINENNTKLFKPKHQGFILSVESFSSGLKYLCNVRLVNPNSGDPKGEIIGQLILNKGIYFNWSDTMRRPSIYFDRNSGIKAYWVNGKRCPLRNYSYKTFRRILTYKTSSYDFGKH
jgi:hypothetical protein